ncbi:hypothetical protein BpHYR1_002070 [Brachionus plicatilis]|uniref:Uncharacterized protein n=1 Tax=Brachionus plicatilis TaxID=10195 RepID=A0A3M7QYT8_BRAPC|nr:hypothetical protein BpHYR1_002070 [Brachionus plicatilis]
MVTKKPCKFCNKLKDSCRKCNMLQHSNLHQLSKSANDVQNLCKIDLQTLIANATLKVAQCHYPSFNLKENELETEK